MQEEFVKKERGEDQPKLIVNEIRILSVDRSVKDIGTWRSALVSAESVYYPNRTRLYDLYEDVLLDAFLTGIIKKRVDSVLNKEIRFRKDKKDVDGMENFLESGAFRNIVETILMTRFWGISGMEFVPGKNVEFEPIPRKNIKPEFGIIAYEQSLYEGIEYKDLDLVWVIGKKRDYGLLLQCSPSALYKKGNFADWAQYIEIFGQPIRVAKYDANDLKTKLELKKAIDEAGSSLALMLPKQAEFEIMDGKISNADGQLQERLKNACNDELAILVLGNTETTSNSHGGSNAKAKEHGKQQLEVTKSDMAYLLTELNSEKFINICKSYGLPVDGGKFVFEKEIDLTALSQKILIDQAVAKQEPIEADYWYNTYDIPKPANYDVLKKTHNAQPAVEEEEAQPKDKPKLFNKKGGKEKLSLMDQFRVALADFFDPAP